MISLEAVQISLEAVHGYERSCLDCCRRYNWGDGVYGCALVKMVKEVFRSNCEMWAKEWGGYHEQYKALHGAEQEAFERTVYDEIYKEKYEQRLQVHG